MPDAVIIGAGMAGLVGGLRAAELGADVLVAEAGSGLDYPCNSRMSGGNLHVARLSPYLEPDRLRAEIDATTAGYVRPAARDLLVDNAPGTVEWLISRGAQVGARSDGEWEQCVLHPLAGPSGSRTEPIGRGPDLTLRRLTSLLADAGGELSTATRVTEVRPGTSRRWTVSMTVAGRTVDVETDRVLFADGGFQANTDLTAAHLGYAGGLPIRRNAGTGLGFGLATCTRLGAQLSHLDAFYGCLVSADAQTDPSLLPYPMLDYVAKAGALIADDGVRVADERDGGVVMANALAHHKVKRGWVVVDDDGWARTRNLGIVGVEARLVDIPSMRTARTLAALGLPPVDESRLQTPPFRAFPVVPAVTHTMGGPLTDQTLTVLHESGDPITGIAVAGSSAGGFEGGPRAGYTGGLLRAAITARVWAQAAFE